MGAGSKKGDAGSNSSFCIFLVGPQTKSSVVIVPVLNFGACELLNGSCLGCTIPTAISITWIKLFYSKVMYPLYDY